MARVAIFVEDRLVRDRDKRVWSANRRLRSTQWQDLGPSAFEAALCARLKKSDAAAESHEVAGEVTALKSFRGLLPGLVNLPILFLQTLRIARRSDLVVAKCPGIVGTVSSISARVARTPLAIHFVGDVEDSVSDGRDPRAGRIRKWFSRELSRWVVRQADAVRYPTQWFLQSKYPASHLGQQYWYTDAAVEPVDTVPVEPPFVQGRIVAIGTQERMYKGHDFLIKALPSIIARAPKAHLILVGQGACRQKLVELTETVGVADRVRFVDSLDGWAEVSTMLRSAHVFAMPSMAEGLPRALLEAMSLGVACVGSDASGIPELLPDDLMVPRGTVKPLADLLVRILTDDAARYKAASICLARSQAFSIHALQPHIDSWQDRLALLATK